MRYVSDYIHALDARKAEIRLSLAEGNAANWESYQRMVGQYAGLEEALLILNNLLKEEDEDE
jgi:hypothetical protein